MAGYPAGLGVAGHPPLPTPSDAPAQSAPLALYYDPVTKDAVVLPTGELAGVHYVDARVALKLSIPRGSIPSVPELGHTLREIQYLADDLTSQVTNRVREAIADDVREGDIAIDRIDVQRGARGFACAVYYRNLRALGSAQRRATVT